jgi:carboxymethylenebutenolidase
MRRIACWVCLSLLGISGLAWPEPPKTETINFKSGDEMISGYLALPESPGRHPALVIIQEWWGLNDWIKEQARRFAEQGYVALAPDLYRGQVTTDPGEAHQFLQNMPPERALRDLRAAFDTLASRGDVNKDKIGSVGWCMGGGLSIRLAQKEPKLAACVVYYGSLPTEPAEVGKIRAPVLGNFGALDRGPSPETVRAFEKAMRGANKSVDVKIYDGAGHGFQNPHNKRGYHAEAAADAWQRTLDFFNKILQGK